MRRILLALSLLPLPALAEPDAAALAVAKGAEVVVLGEIHDNPAHHRAQAELIRAIAPRAVVFEHLSPEQAARATPEALADPGTLGSVLEWEAAGWPDFAIYRPVFEALGGAAVIGAAAPRGEVRRAYAEGAAAVFGEGAARYGLDRPLPEAELAQRIDEQFEAHCRAMPREAMGGMVEAQRFRDARFADAVLDALERHGGPVVLVTGNGHAREDWGVPALIALARPDLHVATVGMTEGQGAGPFDALVSADAPERGDPCARLR